MYIFKLLFLYVNKIIIFQAGQKQLFALGKGLKKRYSNFLSSNPHEVKKYVVIIFKKVICYEHVFFNFIKIVLYYCFKRIFAFQNWKFSIYCIHSTQYIMHTLKLLITKQLFLATLIFFLSLCILSYFISILF